MSQDPLSAWYVDFFTELSNASWRAAMPSESTSAEVDFIIRVTGLRPGSRVLDVACGSGRHTLELARRGCRVTGLDVSAEAIEYARKAAADEWLDVDLRLSDMRALPTDVEVDVAVCMGNSFGYLEHTATQKLLAGLAGLIVPDLHHPYWDVLNARDLLLDLPEPQRADDAQSLGAIEDWVARASAEVV